MVLADHLPDLVADALERVERRQRVLEDHRDVLATDPPQRGLRRADEVALAETDVTGDRRRRSSVEADQAHRHRRLTGPGLPHDGQHLAAPEREVDAVDRLQRAPADVERDR